MRLWADNDPSDAVWKIDCACRERRIKRKNILINLLEINSDFVRAIERVLAPLSLQVRCCQPRCLRGGPVQIDTHGAETVIKCQCATKNEFCPVETTIQ